METGLAFLAGNPWTETESNLGPSQSCWGLDSELGTMAFGHTNASILYREERGAGLLSKQAAPSPGLFADSERTPWQEVKGMRDVGAQPSQPGNQGGKAQAETVARSPCATSRARCVPDAALSWIRAVFIN